jgi:hypothetical protein
LGKYKYEKILNGIELGKECAYLKDFKYFLREDKEIDLLVAKHFQLRKYGDLQDQICIEGSRKLLREFLNIDEEKMDIVEKLQNVQVEGFDSNDELILRFLPDHLVARGIYRFTRQFFDDVFEMGKFSVFCISKQFHDLLIHNIKVLSKRMKNKKMQYRLIKVNNEWRIRGITTTRYHNYDNYLAIYVTLLSLHKYAKEHHINYRIEKAYISDSEIAIFIEQNQPTTIIGFGKVYFGVIIVNNEVKEKAFSMQYRYRIVDDKGNQFGAIPQIEETVYDIKHNTKVEYLAERLNNLNENIRKNIMDQIMAIANTPYLSEDQIYAVFKKIIRSKTLSKETKNKAQRLRDEKVVTNTLSIIEAFNRLNEITTDMDEHIHLERIYYEVLQSFKKKK